MIENVVLTTNKMFFCADLWINKFMLILLIIIRRIPMCGKNG